jgi:AcrR family transcriptional regulator
MSEDARPKRRYDSTQRRERAERTREQVVLAAGRVFVERGYDGATIAAIATEAGVAVETVYRSASGKAGLLAAAVRAALAGGVARSEVPREERPGIRAVIEETDPRARFTRYAEMITGVYRRAGPLLRVLNAAATSHEELAELRDALELQRWEGQRRFAQVLADTGTLRPGLTPQTAADVIYTLQSPTVHDSMVLDRGWTPTAYRDWLADLLARALLDAR